ncbi:hypothetical protein [Micromonospora sp. WMMD737]|uniref:hypothetical protein n=1 Tax=Micromonospora sp. WMMD737 TaxID=3404113 RepID=UPI003B92AE8B
MTTATYRLARQTARWCRFAVVTVEVVPAASTAVQVARTAGGTRVERREAELGAHSALRALGDEGRRWQVTVTEIRATETDTGVGDVHEASARAVWRAAGGGPARRGYDGLADPGLVAAWLRDRLGLRLDGVTEARHWYDGRRDGDTASLLHAWLHFTSCPPALLHGRGEALLLSTEDPYGPYDMAEHGDVRVGPARPPDLLASVVGERLTGAAVLVDVVTGGCGGLLLRLGGTDLLVAAVGDEWVLERDPRRAAVEARWEVRPERLDNYS